MVFSFDLDLCAFEQVASDFGAMLSSGPFQVNVVVIMMILATAHNSVYFNGENKVIAWIFLVKVW